MTTTCRNCDTVLADAYCPHCGQRRFQPEDRRLAHLLGETFEALTDLDGRFWRSLRACLLQPGRIARDWFDGRRARWVSPIRLFLLVNLLYFIAPVLTDLSLPLHNQVRGQAYRRLAPELCVADAGAGRCRGGQFHSAMTEPVFLQVLERERSAAAARGRAFNPGGFEERYNARSDNIGKMLVILHVPFVAAMLALAGWNRRRYYAEHFVVALGLVTFVLLLMQVAVNPLVWLYAWVHRSWGVLPGGGVASTIGYATLGAVLVHFALACRRCYGGGWLSAALRGGLAFLALGLASIFVYRPVQFLLSLWTM